MTQQNATVFRQWIRYGYLAVITVAFVYALGSQWGYLIDGIKQVGLGAILASIALATLGVGVSGLVWLTIIRGFGAKISVRDGARMFFITQLGKYVPGSLWPVAMQADMATQLGIPVRVAVMAQVLFMWVLVVTGAIIGSVINLGALANITNASWLMWLAVASPLLLLLLHPKITVAVLNAILTFLKREPLPCPLNRVNTIFATWWAFVMWFIYGGHLWVLHDQLINKGGLYIPQFDYLIMVSLFAAAWLIGFVIVIAPAGAGPRELMLAAVIGASHGVLIAAISRVALLIADGVLAGIAALLQVRRGTHEGPREG